MKKTLLMIMGVVLLAFMSHAAEVPLVPVETKDQKDQRMKWFREARFGMFIHWGVYPWWRFEPHPEWAPGCFAAGIPGEVRFVYLPRRNIYNWEGPEVKGLEPDIAWHEEKCSLPAGLGAGV